MQKPATLLSRTVAKAIDLVIVAAAFEVLHWSGFMAGILYILIADGLFDGRSTGKILLRLQTLSETGKRIGDVLAQTTVVEYISDRIGG